MTRSAWKVKYVDYKLLEDIIKSKKRSLIITKSRSSTILRSFVGLVIAVYTGRSYTKVYVDEKMIGHKLGEFSFTRKLGKIHQSKKKLQKVQKK